MSKEDLKGLVLPTFDELSKRYDLSCVYFLPSEFVDVKKGGEIEVLENQYTGHGISLVNGNPNQILVEFTNTNRARYTLSEGSWVYKGIEMTTKSIWRSREGNKVVGSQTPVAVFERSGGKKRVAFLVVNMDTTTSF